MLKLQKIAPCLWFDDQADEAAKFYTAIFRNSKITTISRYGEAGREFHGKTPGTVMTVAFEREGQALTDPQRRPGIQVQRSDPVPDQLRVAGSRTAFEPHHRCAGRHSSGRSRAS